jgi:hypothetical protein
MRWTSLWSRQFGKKTSKKSAKLAPVRPRLESLEDRVTPVIDAYGPNPVPPGFVTADGVRLDGVVQLNWPLPGKKLGTASGSFLGDDERRGPNDTMTQLTRAGNAQYILTAAHNLTNEMGAIDVPTVTISFYLPSRPTPYTFNVNASNYRIHPAWNGKTTNGNDIALIDLGEIGPVGPHGIGATPYPINTVGDEVRNQFEFSGFGNTETGIDGQQDGTMGVKRYGYNVFDVTFGNQVAYDYDSGDIWDNSLALFGSVKTPVKTHDSLQGQGDSGGPAFLYDAIAGVTSWTFGESPLDHDFSDIGFMERVSVHRDWIRGHLNVPRGVTLNMANQPFGNDGGTDRIDVRREDTRVVVYVNGHFWVDLPSAGVSAFTILGSSDNENIYIDSSLRETVNLNGGAGTNHLFVVNSSDNLIYTVDATQVTCLKNVSWVTKINPQNISSIEITGDSRDKVTVDGVRSGTPVTVMGAGTVDVGVRSAGSLGLINDTVTVNGNGSTSLFVNDQNWTSRRDYDLFQDRLMVDLFGVARTILYSGLSVMELKGGSAGNVTDVFTTLATITRLYTGIGGDDTRVHATAPGLLAIEGQAGTDTVNLGTSGNAQGIRGAVRINNDSGFTTVNLDNQMDGTSRTVTMNDTANGYVTIARLTPGAIRVASDAVRRLNIWTGDGNDTFTIKSTPQSFPPLSFGTTIRTGAGNDHINVQRTVGYLTLETGVGSNLITVDSNANGLNDINGEITADGQGGVTSLFVNDAVTTATPFMPAYEYIVDSSLVQRTDRAAITYQNVSNLTLFTSQATDFVTIRNTAPFTADSRGTFIGTGYGDDFVTIRGTSGSTRVDLGSGKGSVSAGDRENSLDAIRAPVELSGAGFDVNISNQAETSGQTATISRSTLFGLNSEKVERQELVDGKYVTLNTFNIAFTGGGVVRYMAGQGGDSLFVNGTQPNVMTELYGDKTARDLFGIGFGTDVNDVLGQVSVFGQTANNDFAYYYDFLNPNSQHYSVNGSSFYGLMMIQRPGVAPVLFHGLQAVSLLMPSVGGNKLDVFATPTGTQLGIAAGNGIHDVITLGGSGSKLGGAADSLEGHIFVGSGNANVTIDDTGNTKFAREVSISTYDDFNGTPHGWIVGLAPGGVTFPDRANLNVRILGGELDDRFLMSGSPLATRMEIDGGKGNDILVGTGGNILRGGDGRDLLIAGATASYLYGDGGFGLSGEDILIGGTTIYDTNRSMLEEIMTVWTAGNEYADRSTILHNGLLSDGTVTANAGQNYLYGMGEKDLFWAAPLDETDLNLDGVNLDEQVVWL